MVRRSPPHLIHVSYQDITEILLLWHKITTKQKQNKNTRIDYNYQPNNMPLDYVALTRVMVTTFGEH